MLPVRLSWKLQIIFSVLMWLKTFGSYCRGGTCSQQLLGFVELA